MRIVWSILAREDLRIIDEGLLREASPEISVRILSAIAARATFLANFPHGGRPYRNGQCVLRVYDTRYLIRHRIRGEDVEVIRVHHEREDWQSLL